MSATPNVKVDLTQNLKSLHLPTIRQCYEEVARQAELIPRLFRFRHKLACQLVSVYSTFGHAVRCLLMCKP